MCIIADEGGELMTLRGDIRLGSYTSTNFATHRHTHTHTHTHTHIRQRLALQDLYSIHQPRILIIKAWPRVGRRLIKFVLICWYRLVSVGVLT